MSSALLTMLLICGTPAEINAHMASHSYQIDAVGQLSDGTKITTMSINKSEAAFVIQGNEHSSCVMVPQGYKQ